MAFLDSITKKASEASAKAIQKGKELSDTTRLNSLISEEEKRITNTYHQIGKLYTSIHINDYENEFSGMMEAITDSEKKISDYKKQISVIKGVTHCEKCGAEVPRGAAFCSSCGATMPEIQNVEDTDMVRCENCGAQVKKEMRFCTNCGKAMKDISVRNTVENEEKNQKKSCPVCGAKVEGNMAFCTECGAKLE